MADGQHNPSRRTLLGAVVGIPFVRGVGAEEAPPPGFTRSPSPANAGEDWDKALTDFEAAQTKVLAIEAATAGCGFADEEALLPAHDAACEAMEAALGRVMLAAAPDFAGFAVKLELFFDYQLEPHSVDPDALAAVRADVRRLAGAV